MLEWLLEGLHAAFPKGEKLPTTILVYRFVAALVLGCVVAGIYRWTRGRKDSQTLGLTGTLVLLSVLICMVSVVIGDNIARAFSLVGALAIVRFRTVVEDTRDTAFVIFAVAVGMAVGAGYLEVPLLGIPFAAIAAILFRPRGNGVAGGTRDFTLILRIGTGHSPDNVLRESFAKHVARFRLVGTVTARQGAAFDLTYSVRLHREDAVIAFVTELNGLEGVQNVELREA